jgi:hypothetical protein
MSRLEWARHAVVFVASLGVVYVAGVLAPYFIDPGAAGPLTLGSVLGHMAPPTLIGLLLAFPIYMALAICQALTFHYVKRFTTPLYLGVLFVLALLFAIRYTPA